MSADDPKADISKCVRSQATKGATRSSLRDCWRTSHAPCKALLTQSRHVPGASLRLTLLVRGYGSLEGAMEQTIKPQEFRECGS